MCGILFSYSSEKNKHKQFLNKLDRAFETIKTRGPDNSNSIIEDNFIMGHTHLVITGFREQPIKGKNYLLTYNGEIYNDYKKIIDEGLSDADLLKEYIDEFSENAFKKLDGEFAIILYYPDRKKLFISTDTFGTKPLYFQINEKSIVVGSYISTVECFDEAGRIIRAKPNTIYEIDLNFLQIINEISLHEFDFSNQIEDSYDKWIELFEKSIEKRTYNNKQKYFVSFSSGHDSGLIAAEMLKQKRNFKTYSFTYLEDIEILNKRINILNKNLIENEILYMSTNEKELVSEFMRKNLDSYIINNEDTKVGEFPNKNIFEISGYIASSFICNKAKNEGRLISLSGQGADEIITDYYNKNSRSVKSTIKNEWNKISGPWPNFFGGWNRTFLGATERIGGLYGIETRYPFLDIELVQSYLHISPEYKKNQYKAPISEMLNRLNFPYHNFKQGFAAYEN